MQGKFCGETDRRHFLIVPFGFRNLIIRAGLSYIGWSLGRPIINYQGECKMSLPATISAWCLFLFFLWYGLAAFIPALNSDMFKKVGAVLALLYAVLGLFGM